ncbi:thiamine phosphate synthase [Haloimpatiens sp. FM7330]|uniref:thiamine phosphate synthase n=1 Tax=Haloimpatiens sp. FM7330 TaxID=3298610 RepID=UPI003641FC4A
MLYLITNRKLVKNKNFFSVIEDAVQGGVNVIILREKDLSYEDLMKYALGIKKIIRGTKVSLIINSNLEVAKDVEADGYHIGFQRFINEKPSENMLIGVSVHNLEEAILSEKYGASYIIASHIYATDCKKGLKPKGVKFIEDIKEKINIPVIALGGIKPENIKEVLDNGADGAAVMSYIMAADNPYKAAVKLKKY